MPLSHSIEEREYENGAKALLVNIPDAQVMAYGVNFRVRRDATSHPQQTLHTLEHVASSYTTHPEFQDKKALRREIEKNGAYVNASTYDDKITYYGDCTSDELERVLLLRRMLLEQPDISDHIVQSEKGNVSQEIRRNVTNYPRMAYTLARKALNNTYFTDAERLDSVSGITAEDVRDVYAQTHVTSNQKFLIVGDLARIGDMEGLLGGWKLERGNRLFVPRASFDDSTFKYERHESLKTDYVTVAFSINRDFVARDYEVMKVINYMLFNSQGSRVFGEARSQGIGYQMWGYIDESRTNPNWHIDFPVSTDNLQPLVGLIALNLSLLYNGAISEDEVAGAVRYCKGKFKKSGQTSEDVYRQYASDYFDRDVVMPLSERESAYESIGVEDVIALAKEFIEGKLSIGGAGGGEESAFIEACQPLVQLIAER